jgi:hypothetical protein
MVGQCHSNGFESGFLTTLAATDSVQSSLSLGAISNKGLHNGRNTTVKRNTKASVSYVGGLQSLHESHHTLGDDIDVRAHGTACVDKE